MPPEPGGGGPATDLPRAGLPAVSPAGDRSPLTVAAVGASTESAETARTSEWAVETIQLSRDFGPVRAVDHLDLQVHWGEIFGFLGPNGAGKTTTIRMLTGLLRPTAGVVRVAGFDMATASLAARRRVAYLPDMPYLYTKLTGREFIHFVAGLYAVPATLVNRRLSELLPLFGLEDRADDLIEGYSHGMKQKTLLAAALVHDPEVLILDEPTVGLDPRSARLLRDILRQLVARGATVFLSTHILEIAERLCDRIGIIDAGRLIASGTVSELHQLADRQGTLEDIFLALTGGPAFTEITEVLR